jgi:hypothetical protein
MDGVQISFSLIARIRRLAEEFLGFPERCVIRLSSSLEVVTRRFGFPLNNGEHRSFRMRGVALCLLSGSSNNHAFDDLGKPIAGVGKGIEIVLAQAATFDNSSMPQ